MRTYRRPRKPNGAGWIWLAAAAACLAISPVRGQSLTSSRFPATPPDVQAWLSQLPNTPLTETILTKKPEPIDVTIVRVRSSEFVAFSKGPQPQETLDPGAPTVWHSISYPDITGPTSAKHDITIPRLHTGLYDILLRAADRSVVQRLNVGTLGVAVNRSFKNSVLIATDLRTGRQRADVMLTEYSEQGPRRFIPGRDGLIRFPYPWMGRTDMKPPLGLLVATASDGSVAPIASDWSISAWDPVYFETDRGVYRPGDRLFHRSVARYLPQDETYVWIAGSGTTAVATWFPFTDRVAEGSVRLPLDASTGIYDQGSIFVSDTLRSRFELEAGPVVPRVHAGQNARFVVSVLDRAGRPVAGLRVPYAWHNATMPFSFPLQMRVVGEPDGRLERGTAVTDNAGNALVSVPTRNQSVELYAYDPDTHEIAADARVDLLRSNDLLAIVAPFWQINPQCVTLAAKVTGAAGIPKANQQLGIEIRPNTESVGDTAAPVLRRELRTGAGGYALVPWCPRAMAHGWYSIAATEGAAASPRASARAIVTVTEGPPQSQGVLMVAADAPIAKPGVPLAMTATSLRDGPALVLYGSGFDYQARTAAFHDNVAHFSVVPPPDSDAFTVSVSLASGPNYGTASTSVAVEPKRHLLRVRIACTNRHYVVGETATPCVSVVDATGRGLPARLLVTVTRATAATLANAGINPEAVYEELYAPQPPNNDYVYSPNGVTDSPPTSYLYPIAPAPASTQSPNRPLPTPSSQRQRAPAPGPPQTTFWNNHEKTSPLGRAVLRVAFPHDAVPGTYLIRLVAVADRGGVGEAHAVTILR